MLSRLGAACKKFVDITEWEGEGGSHRGNTLTLTPCDSVVVNALHNMIARCRMDSATFGARRYWVSKARMTTWDRIFACSKVCH